MPHQRPKRKRRLFPLEPVGVSPAEQAFEQPVGQPRQPRGVPLPADTAEFLNAPDRTQVEKDQFRVFEQSQAAAQQARDIAKATGQTTAFADPISGTGQSFVGAGGGRRPIFKRPTRKERFQQRKADQQRAVFAASPQGKQFADLIAEDIQKNPHNAAAGLKQLQEAGMGDTAIGRFAAHVASTQPLSPIDMVQQRIELAEQSNIRIKNMVSRKRFTEARTLARDENRADLNAISTTLTPEVIALVSGEGLFERFQTVKREAAGKKDPLALRRTIEDLLKDARELAGPVLRKVQAEEAKLERTEQEGKEAEQAKVAEQTFKEEEKRFTDELGVVEKDTTQAEATLKELEARKKTLKTERVSVGTKFHAARDKRQGAELKEISGSEKFLQNRHDEIDKELVEVEKEIEGAKGEVDRLGETRTEVLKTRPRRQPVSPLPEPAIPTEPPPVGTLDVDLGTGEIATPVPGQQGTANIDDLAKQVEEMVTKGVGFQDTLDQLQITDQAVIDQLLEFFRGQQ